MFRKVYYYASSAIILILILTNIYQFVSQNNDDKIDYSNWNNDVNTIYSTVKPEIGEVRRSVRYSAKVELNDKEYLTYLVDKENDTMNLYEGQIVRPGDIMDSNNICSVFGRVEDITETESKYIVKVSDFSKLKSTVLVEQKNSYYVKIGENTDVIIDGKIIKANIFNHSYKIEDGFLSVEVEYETNEFVFEGSDVDVQFLLESRQNVLTLPKSVVLFQNNKYYVNILDGDRLYKSEIKVGLIGDENVEVKNGVNTQTKVVCI